MKIFGIGTDIVNIKRLEKLLKKNGLKFKNRIFSKDEILYCEKRKNPFPFYAKRFAAKEALSKALGTGIKRNYSKLIKKKLREKDIQYIYPCPMINLGLKQL